MAEFRRGAAEVHKAQEQAKNRGGGGAFAPTIFWKDDKDEKFLLILTSIEDMPRVDTINMIEIENERQDGSTYTSWNTVIARTDPAIGERKDPMVTDWDAKTRDSNIVLAVELEATVEDKRGRKRPTGFHVKLTEYDRRVRDEEGKVTEETETVVTPEIGFINQAVGNFGAAITTYDEGEAPINETPVKIMRVGKGTNTQYAVVGYPEIEIDLTDFVANLDGIGYLADILDEVVPHLDFDDPKQTAQAVGVALLEKYLNELIDEDRYNRILAGVEKKGESLDKFGNKDKKKNQRNGNSASSRPSQRQAKPKDESEADEKPKSKQQDPKAQERIAGLRERAAAKAAQAK